MSVGVWCAGIGVAMGASTWLHHLPPGALLVLGALLLPLLRGMVLRVALLALPLLSGWHLASFEVGTVVTLQVGELMLTPVRVDRLSLVWGVVFHLAAFLAALYALGVRDRWQHLAGLSYAGSALCAVFAGDLLTLFVFWELTAVTSVFLVWAPHGELPPMEREHQARRSRRAGMRYLVVQVGSGVVLLAGLIERWVATGSLDFGAIDLGSAGGLLIFLAFGVKAAFPLLHNWVQDAYPEANATGTVFLSAFTTKMAIYALARGFAGTSELIWIGAVMAVFPVFFALVENDLRRVLAYSLNNQLGFMVVAVGIGSELALNGAAAHAVAHVLYKALLFMAMGAVLLRTGTAKASELGGLHRSMPWTTLFCLVGGASISAFPLTGAFVTKSLILSAAAEEHHTWVWLALLFASAGGLLYAGLKVPYFTFFGRDAGYRVDEAPPHMLAAMGLGAALCLVLGIFPGLLYGLLPFALDYHAYTAFHVVSQLQMLLFSALAFVVLLERGLYPRMLRSTVLDSDWIYRKPLVALVRFVRRVGGHLWHEVLSAAELLRLGTLGLIRHYHGPNGLFARTWPASAIVQTAVAMLGVYLLLFFLLGS